MNDITPLKLPATAVCNDRQSWLQAQGRVLRYVNALEVDPVQALEITQQALRRAASEVYIQTANQIHPVAASMQALRSILAETRTGRLPQKSENPCPLMPAGFQHVIQHTGPVRAGKNPMQQWLPIMPELNRGRMVPENVKNITLKNILTLVLNGRR